MLLDESFRQSVAANRGRNPLDVALDKRVAYAKEVATQLKYLKRAESKLPSFAAAECILPARAFEQSSSEAVAACKRLSGDRVLDLTCGLGVDTFALSMRFREVVSLEHDPLLAAITRENMRRLGVTNVRIENCSAEEFVASTNEHFDWIYADPDRRSTEGKKLVCLEECSPNILAMRPALKRLGGALCLKNSPLFDVDEALRLFPQSRVEVISLHNECKEVLIYDDQSGPSVAAEAIGLGRIEVPLEARNHVIVQKGFDPTKYRWLLIPDVALQKARLVRHHLAPYGFVASENGYVFLEEPHEGVLGRVFEIEHMEHYAPKQLKRTLKGQKGVIRKQDFPYSESEIRHQIGLREGADLLLAFTRIEGTCWSIFLKK